MKINALSLALLSALTSTVAHSEIQARNQLNEIQVIAVKEVKPQPVQKTKIKSKGASLPSIMVEPSAGQTTAQTLQSVPSVNITGGPRQVGQSINVRGLSGNQVAVAIDGINNQFSGFGHNQLRSLPNPFLYKEITVDPSGGNILYGSGNIGGSINFTTIDPDDLLGGKNYGGKVTFGASSGAPGFNTGVAVAAKTGSVSYLFDILGDRNSNIHLGGGGALADSSGHNIQYLGKVTWDIDSAQQLKFSYLSMQNIGTYPATTSKEVSATNPATDFNIRQSQAITDYHFDPTDNPYVDFNAQAFYLQTHQKTSPITPSVWVEPQDITIDTWGGKVNNTSSFQSPIGKQKLLYGIDYTYINGRDSEQSSTILNMPTGIQNQYAGFIQDTWSVFKNFDLIFGGRYDGYNSHSGSSTNANSHFSKQLTFNYQVLKALRIFGGYTEGFRAPTISELYLSGSHPGGVPVTFIANPNLKPEISHNKELGFEVRHAFSPSQQAMFRTTIFYNNVDNYIMNTNVGFDPGAMKAVNQNINIDHARLYGFTMAAGYQNHYFNIATNFTYTRGQTLSDYTNDKGVNIPSGSNLPIPQAKGQVSLGIPLPNIESKITTRMDYALRQNNVPADTYQAAGYVLLGLVYQWHPHALKGFEINVGIDNILDQKYIIFDGSNSTIPAMGRNAYASVNYRF